MGVELLNVVQGTHNILCLSDSKQDEATKMETERDKVAVNDLVVGNSSLRHATSPIRREFLRYDLVLRTAVRKVQSIWNTKLEGVMQ